MSEDILEFKDEYRWLSNFWPCRVEFEGSTYPSVEHAYQAAKTDNLDKRYAIGITTKASDAKRMGRGLKLRDDWEEMKWQVMRTCLASKFSDPNLRAALVDTAGKTLVEGNFWHDNIWGKCYCSKCYEMRRQPGYLDFTNQLGKILMELRTELVVQKGM